jgi:hypothetical protein
MRIFWAFVRILIPTLLAINLCPGSSEAGTIIIGPGPDFRTSFDIPGGGILQFDVESNGKFEGSFGGLDYFICYNDEIEISATGTFTVYFDSYVELGIVGDPQFEPDVVLTDVIAMVAGDPANEVPLQTGFDPANPQVVPLTGETFIGTSEVFPATVTAYTLAELPSVLPGFDLSKFVGDPNSIVYLAQATVPLAQCTTCVPELSTWAMMLLGFSGLGFAGWRARRRTAAFAG